MGTSKELRVGQNVFAIGNPFGPDWTMTTGIVSALNRELPGDGDLPIRGLFQTDAAINPGNSGGPLDSAGRLIGVNTAIFSPSDGSAGIGFAVPVDTVNRVVPQLIARGRYAPPRLGIRFDPQVDAALARNGTPGVLVLAIDLEGPAARASLMPTHITSDGRIVAGDRIVVGDTKIDDAPDLLAALERYSPGDTVNILTLRGDQPLRVAITLGDPS